MAGTDSEPRADTPRADAPRAPERAPLDLAQAATMVLDECRMVLPGIQGLFGFQLIAVFSPGFGEQLTHGEQELHLLATALTGVAIALIMTPAATHRQLDPCEVTLQFIRLSTRLLLLSMVPLGVALCLDFYLVARAISPGSSVLAWALALAAVFVGLWWVLPRWVRHRTARR
jgi:hypothetical protein